MNHQKGTNKKRYNNFKRNANMKKSDNKKKNENNLKAIIRKTKFIRMIISIIMVRMRKKQVNNEKNNKFF